MLSATSHGEVMQMKLSRYPDLISGMWVCAYFVDGLLIDTGPAHTAKELAEFLRSKPPETAVNTHFHEDHISANHFLRDAYRTRIFAHRDALDKIAKPVVCRPNDDMKQILADLKKLRDLHPSILFPAPTHVVAQPGEKLDRLIAYLEETDGKIEKLHKKGMTPDDIRKQLFGDEGFIYEATQRQFSSLNIVCSFLRGVYE